MILSKHLTLKQTTYPIYVRPKRRPDFKTTLVSKKYNKVRTKLNVYYPKKRAFANQSESPRQPIRARKIKTTIKLRWITSKMLVN